MKNSRIILLFTFLNFISFSKQDYFFDVDDVFSYLDYQGYETEEKYKQVISNLSKIFKDSYAFYDISKNPPQPSFNDYYHAKIDIEERLNSINTTDINTYEFYRRIITALSDLKYAHIDLSFKDFEFKDFYVTAPFDYYIGPDDEGKPRIFIDCLDDAVVKEFFNKIDLLYICKTYTSYPVKSINGKDPFEYILNLGGNVISTKNIHGTFTYKMRQNNVIPLTDFIFDLEEDDYSKLELILDNEENTQIITKYKCITEHNIFDDMSFLRSLSHGRGFYVRDDFQNKINNKDKHNIKFNVKEKYNKRKNVTKIKNDNKAKMRKLDVNWQWKKKI